MVEMVAVACKHPTGLHLDLVDASDERVRVTLRGNAQDLTPGRAPREFHGGYAITMVPKDHWDAWSKLYADSPLIKNGIVFARAKAVEAQAQARDQAKVKPIAPRIDVNDADKSTTPGVSNITVADKAA